MSRDMVTSYVETLIERITGVDKAVPDADGDYPVRHQDALYFIRVAGNDLTLVALPSTELDDMITRYPAPKDSERTFSDQLRFELVSRTVIGRTVIDHERVFRSPDATPFEVAAIYTFAGDKIARVDFVKA